MTNNNQDIGKAIDNLILDAISFQVTDFKGNHDALDYISSRFDNNFYDTLNDKNIKPKHVHHLGMLSSVLDKYGLNYYCTEVEKIILHVNKIYEEPSFSKEAVFNYLEQKKTIEEDTMHAALLVTKAKISNQKISNQKID